MERNLYVALGDSVTAGYSATHPSLGFTTHVAEFCSKQGLANRTLVIAKNGWTSRDIGNAVHTLPPAVWEAANVLTLIAGGNDLRRLLRRQYLSLSGAPISPQMVAKQLDEFTVYMDHLCSFLKQKNIPHIILATIYNPVPHFPLGVDAIEGLNQVTRQIAEHYKFGLIHVYERFRNNEALYIEGYRNGRFEDLASPFRRPIHPNNMGHREIAHLINEYLSGEAIPKPKPKHRREPNRRQLRGRLRTRRKAW
ncbi:SGNH/GDSL hydrolase family protein [Alicyclobacillus ferrooxydans]|uniref:SGNH hydrolase-type esterase domain-containing protein n=1 Tax=Alicyclobacillus ferrooxydans TaxID=471514 RepID=A0A0P9F2I7_9BACL|nr:SGNH/GDSL hydrolase family protein [Alicyclobacillus ferrooxydans]KPV45576.1 hypothetical protein AN477_01205 [Alicyclobacillus ferrooxydans]